jgi:hypothetical protein
MAVAAIALPVLLISSDSVAQAVRVSAESEIFRKNANGRRLAEVLRGTRLALVRIQGDWAEVSMEGWMPTSSLSPTTREGFNRVVTRVGGEELRASPDGDVTARLLQGFLLDVVEEQARWSHVRRMGWMWRPSLADLMAPAGEGESEAPRPAPPAVVAAGERVVAGSNPVDLRTAPEGDTIAVIRPGSGLRVVERGNRWTRVIIDGWVRSSELATSNPDSILAGVSAAAVRATPEDYLGRTVRWSVQFISLERAEPERTDFYEGEPFILARAPDPADGFVYLAVPPELLPDVQQLDALEMIDVLAQVRMGRSVLMGVPVLDLVAIF